MSASPDGPPALLFPKISIVTPSFNQGRYIGETLQSLLDQSYPNLEVIIQDGGSTDGAIQIAEAFAAKHPEIFKLFVEKDSGQADALNKGFARTTGDILGFLNSDDTFYPGCLQSVARHLGGLKGPSVVFGRCLFTGEGSPYCGVEHPAKYTSHFEHLAIWKRGHNTIPQPSVFWKREVWTRCGGFNEKEGHVLDYDLFCRMSAKYRFHKVDELWSTYRMHPVSKSSLRTEAEILEMSIAVSRRYWGGPFSPLRWRCEISHWLHSAQCFEKAKHHARRCEEAARAARYGEAFIEFSKTSVYSPKVGRERLLKAWFSHLGVSALNRLLKSEPPFTGRHADAWVGPLYRSEREVPPTASKLILTLEHIPQGNLAKIVSKLLVNGRTAARQKMKNAGSFNLEADVARFRGKIIKIELQTDDYFIPRLVHNTNDDRQLSVQLRDEQWRE